MQKATRVVMPKPYEVITETYEIGTPGQGQVLVANEASAISAGTELAVYTGVHQWLNDPTRTWPRFPFVPGFSRIHRVVPGQAPTIYATGLTNVTDLAWHDGDLYAVQIGILQGGPGSLVKVNPGGSATTVAGGLFAPYGIAVSVLDCE